VVQWRSATAVVESGRDIFARADQTAPLSLQDVLQVTVLPLMQTLQTSTHWLNFFGSKLVYCRAMQTRCSSVYSTCCEQDANQIPHAAKTTAVGSCTGRSDSTRNNQHQLYRFLLPFIRLRLF
jgi:hypothetical protein